MGRNVAHHSQVLQVNVISVTVLVAYCSCVGGGGSWRGFYLTLAAMASPPPSVRESVSAFCQLLSRSAAFSAKSWEEDSTLSIGREKDLCQQSACYFASVCPHANGPSPSHLSAS